MMSSPTACGSDCRSICRAFTADWKIDTRRYLAQKSFKGSSTRFVRSPCRAAMDPRRLAQAICQEREAATAKCSGFSDKDIVLLDWNSARGEPMFVIARICSVLFRVLCVNVRLLIGCCGSGKTTVTSYTLGTSFRYSRRTGKLEAENPMEGFVMSAQCADVTRGLSCAEVSWRTEFGFAFHQIEALALQIPHPGSQGAQHWRDDDCGQCWHRRHRRDHCGGGLETCASMLEQVIT